MLLANSATHLFLGGEPRQTTDFILLILGAGYNLLWTSWLIVFLAAGFDDMILKPFRENEIFQIFTRLLGTRFVWEEESATPAECQLDALLETRLTSLVQ